MSIKKFKATLEQQGSGSAAILRLPFDPKEAFGKVRAPVTVTIGRFTFRSTVFRMAEADFVVVNRANREASGAKLGDRVMVTMDLDTKKRVITPPADLAKALRKDKSVWAKWEKLSYTHKREHIQAIEAARKPETRERRIAAAVAMVAAKK